MPRAGIFGAAHVPAAAGGGISIVKTDVGHNDASSTSYTFTGRALGAASADRLIIVAAATRGNYSVSGVSVAGVPATLLIQNYASGTGEASLWVAAVPSGTTGDVVISTPTNVSRMLFSVHAVTGASASPTDTGVTDDASTTDSITVASGGAIIGAVVNYYSGGDVTFTWTGVTESAHDLADGIIAHGAGFNTSPGSGSVTVGVSASNTTSGGIRGAFAALEPV